MNAVISGTAGRALLVDGESLKSFDVDDPSKLVDRQQSDLPYLFGEGRDLRVIENSDLESISRELQADSDLTLALDLTLISLDEELEEDIRKDALQDLDELLADGQSALRLENILYARPLPDDGDLVNALKFCADSHLPNALSLLQRFEEYQSVIAEVSAAWDIIPTKVFGSQDNHVEFQQVAVREGLFRSFVLALAKPRQPRIHVRTETQAKLSAFFLNSSLNPLVKGLRNHRQIMQSWTNSFRLPSEAVTVKHEIEEEERKATPRRKHGRRVGIDRQAVLREVRKRKAIISGAIQRRDFESVRGLTGELIDYQLGSGETEHLAKSLCDLAMEAKELGMFSLQLELTERSVNIAPDDGWSWAQYGDALLNVQRLDEALRAYQQADAFGAGVIAKKGSGEVLKAQGEFDAALVAFDDVIRGHPDDVVAKTGRAEVLKAQGQLPAARAAYDEAIREHPENPVAKAGLAEVLKAQGHLPAALAAFDEIIREHPADVVAKAGRAEVLKAQGQFPAALAAYDQIIREHPESVVARTGRAEVLKAKGDLPAALIAYNEIRVSHPEHVVARTGRSCVLAVLGQYEEALADLPTGDPVTQSDWIALHIRGMILLRLRKVDEAIKLFQRGMEEDPIPSSKEYFRSALAVALLGRRKYEPAIRVLDDIKTPHLQPQANVFRIHSFGGNGQLDEAKAAFQNLRAKPWEIPDELVDELHRRYILRQPPAHSDDWVFDQEVGTLLLVANRQSANSSYVY